MRVPGILYVQGRNDYTDSDGKKYGIAIHNTSNDASDEGEASYATRRTDGVSSHFYVDDDSVTQSINTDDRVGHAGSKNGNENAIAFEITGGNGMSRSWWLANVAWDKMAQVIAYMLKHDPDLVGFQIRRATVAEMKANPKIKAFYGHDDMRRAWGGTTHTDPGPNFPWDKLISSVKAAMGGGEDDVMNTDQDARLKRIEAALIGTGTGSFALTAPGGEPGASKQSLAQQLAHFLYAFNLNPAGSGTFGAAWMLALAEKTGTSVQELEELQTQAAARHAELVKAVGNVDVEVIEALGANDRDPAEVAALLRVALGDKADAVFEAGLGQN